MLHWPDMRLVTRADLTLDARGGLGRLPEYFCRLQIVAALQRSG